MNIYIAHYHFEEISSALISIDWNFFVLAIGRGRGVLEVTEVLRGGGRRWCRHEARLHIF